MRIGIALGLIHPALWAEVSRKADLLGYESVWLSEHLVFPVDMDSAYPGGETPVNPATPLHDAPTFLANIAAVTEHVLLGTNIYLAALRHPFTVARSFATLDHLSGGRAVLGVGAGWLRSEATAVGVDPRTRGARLDENIGVVRRLWTEEVIEHHGTFYDFESVMFEPKPLQRPHPPILIGGESPAALRRAALVGDGWIGMPTTTESGAAMIAALREACDKVGRKRPLEITMTDLSVRSADDVNRWASLGVDRLVVRPWSRSSEAVDGLERFAETAIAGNHRSPHGGIR